MIDLGTLRRPRDLSLGTSFVPTLYNQIQCDMQAHHDNQDQIDEFLSESMRDVAISHKQSIVKELNKRQEKKKEEMRKKREEEEQRRKRKERRAALREKDRIAKLKDIIMKDIVATAEQHEYSPKMKVYDVRDPNTSNDGIVIVGGFVGELIISFKCMLDYILSYPNNQNFFFSVEMIQQFFEELFLTDEFPDGICTINLTKDLTDITQGRDLAPAQIAKLIREKGNITDFGLKFMFDIMKELDLQVDVIEVIYTAICKIATKKPEEPAELLVVPEGAEEEEKDRIEEENSKIKEANELKEKENAKIAKL
jgi:hypothetical protein